MQGTKLTSGIAMLTVLILSSPASAERLGEIAIKDSINKGQQKLGWKVSAQLTLQCLKLILYLAF